MPFVVPTATDIRRARTAAGLTQAQTAALIGYKRRTMSDFERGRMCMRPAMWELLEQKLSGAAAEVVLRQRLETAATRFRRELGAGRGHDVARGKAARTGVVRDYRALLRLALATCEPQPTLQQVADWCGFSVHALRSWLRPPTNRSARPVPRSATLLMIWELSARDRSGTDWAALFAACR